ncbi:hypothetical protein K08M4_27520 [Vibrio syngnathi]|uniref:Transposase DDE domain-containing protein n=1 Tax=Vibrio syngnathi TaxID=3034029 RepID=A0AA34TST0_9VIBR|nr:hypothetical protein K08M4_27520 [Vibrio syngnathi]
MPLRSQQGFIDSIFRLDHVPLSCPHYTCISRRAKQVEVSFKTRTRGEIQHLAIDPTGLKVYGEGEWKVKRHGTDGKRRVWRKLHIAVDTSTHEIIAAELSLSTVTDGEVLSNLLKQTRRSILEGQVITLTTRERATMLLRLSELLRLFLQEKGVPSGSVGPLEISQ